MSRYCSYLASSRISKILLATFLFLVLLVGAGVSPLGLKEEIVFTHRVYTVYGLAASFFHVYGYLFLGLCFINVIFMFSYTMKRDAFEKEQLLPISKKDILITRYIWGYVETIIIFLVASIFGLLILLGATNRLDIYGIALLFCLAMIILGIFPYSFFAFFFLKGRNILDGIVLMVLAFFAPLFIGNGLLYLYHMILSGKPLSGFIYSFYPFSILEWVIVGIEDMVDSTSNFMNVPFVIVGISFLYQVATIFGFFYTADDYTVEMANQKTTSLLGYRLLIPLTFISMVFLKSTIEYPLFYFWGPLAILFTYLMYSLSYRNFIFDKKQLRMFIIIAGVEFVLYIIFLLY